VDRYSFLVRLFHPLLHAGLSRRTNISITLKIPGCLPFFPKRTAEGTLCEHWLILGCTVMGLDGTAVTGTAVFS
jgi:hypothetical protein